MPERQMTKALEDCLEAVLDLTEKKGQVRVTDLAEYLKISKPSVNYAVVILTEMGLLDYEKYGKIILNDRGRVKAREVMGLHLLLKRFLTEVMGVSEATAENDACKIEHIISPETVERIQLMMEEGKKNPAPNQKPEL
jgi:DtxR family Mn-dependent transcriptional regulator